MSINCTYLEVKKIVKLDSIREMRHLLEQATQSRVPHASLRRHILLCLSEAITNFVTHPACEASKMGMSFGRDNLGWWLEITDNGNPWDPTEQRNPEILDEFREVENGRGVALLHMLSDEIEYQPSDNSHPNRLRLRWRNPDRKLRPNILVVDDDASLRRLYELYLDESFEVTTAASGQEALMALNAGQVDLVLSDICMPQVDGIGLREKLVNDADLQLIPFVFVTATTNASHSRLANELGIDDYLVKPVDKAKLIGTVQRVLKRSRQIHQRLTDRLDKGITSALLPGLPGRANGWRFGVMSRHTGRGGGDLLLHQSGDEIFQLVLADIMGHDDSAKFFAHACGGYLRGVMLATEADEGPAKLLEQLSEFALKDKLMSKVTVTCCSAALQAGGKINLACAGHPPPLYIKKSGAEPLQVGGVLPGLVPATDYQAIQLRISAGERIALYTDGLFEAAADNISRKELEENITRTLTDTLGLSIDDALATLMGVFDRFAAVPPIDDALLLLMEPGH